ncbi:MAG: hypothetical protein M3Q33_12655 [Acidobacteriota bacterium]|nr:hypothetical protein [Acidobacteriota bacterium]
MTNKVFLTTLFHDDNDLEEIFGIFFDREKAASALRQFSIEIETEPVEDLDYEISEYVLDESNYLLNRKYENS